MCAARARSPNRYRELVRAVSTTYPDLEREVGRDRLDEGGQGDVDHELALDASAPARALLRCADTLPSLFRYQADLVAQILSLCSAAPPKNVGLVSLPTGAGKTRTAAVALLTILQRSRTYVVLWLAPTRELLAQGAATLESMWTSYRGAPDIELVRADLLGTLPNDVHHGVIFATPHMVAARMKRRELPDPDLVVFDEAHHIEAPVFRKAVENVRATRNVPMFGLSATPGRSSDEETESLVEFFGGHLLRSRELEPDPIKALRRLGVLSKVSFRQIPIVPFTLSDKDSGGPRSGTRGRDELHSLVRLVTQLSKKARVLVFAESVDYSRLLAAALRCEGVAAAAVSSRDLDEQRRAKLARFERGELSVLVNKSLLATGYDCPAIRHVVLATQIGSAILFEQIVGRASRGPMVGGHSQSTVWQFVSHEAMHGAPQSYLRFKGHDWKGPV